CWRCAKSPPAASTSPTWTPSTRPSASARSARRWSGPPPRWSPTTTCRRATTDRRTAGTGNGEQGTVVPGPLETAPETGPFCIPAACFSRSLFPVPCSRLTLKAMTPSDPAHATPDAAPDAVPDYVRVLEQAADYLPAEQLGVLRRAWTIGAAAHAGQNRRSGEPYITHPVAVATALAEQHVDVETLVAAILHDTLEDTPLSRESIAGEFGETVAE